MLSRISQLLTACGTSEEVLPATALYNEGWMLRLVLDWFSRRPPTAHPLSFSPDARWYSEARLPSQFLARHRGDPLAESWTHADGVIGHITVGGVRKGELVLLPSATHFVVTEAKLFSELSPGVTHVDYFDQAARSVASMVEVLCRQGQPAPGFQRLAFYVLAPAERIDARVFVDPMSKVGIRDKVERRVLQYEGEKIDWLRRWFAPALDRMEVLCLPWEHLLEHIRLEEPATGEELLEFYHQCLEHNRPGRRPTS